MKLKVLILLSTLTEIAFIIIQYRLSTINMETKSKGELILKSFKNTNVNNPLLHDINCSMSYYDDNKSVIVNVTNMNSASGNNSDTSISQETKHYVNTIGEKFSLKLTDRKIVKQVYKLAQGIHNIFERHSIQYYVGFGSAIGLLRHQGLIPWDDDLDLLVPIAYEPLLLGKVAYDLEKEYDIEVMPAFPNYKIFFKSDPVLNWVAQSDDMQKWRYPFCDIFITQTDETGEWDILSNEAARTYWPAKIMNTSGIYPIRLMKFGNFKLRVSSDTEGHLNRQFGRLWKTVGSTADIDHLTGFKLKVVTFQIPSHLFCPILLMTS